MSATTYKIMGFDVPVIETTERVNPFAKYTDEDLCAYMLNNEGAIDAHIEFNNRGYHVLTCEALARIYAHLMEGTAPNFKPAIKRTIKRLEILGDKIITPRILKNAERLYWAKSQSGRA